MMTTTPSAVTPITMIFAFNDNFVLRALDGLSEEELWKAPTKQNNSILWVAGHVVQTRADVLQMLGEPGDTGWGKLFERGAKVSNTNKYPSREDIGRVMKDVSPRLYAKLGSLKEEHLTRPATIGVPGTKTFADELAFFALHDSYHIGQMAYIRKGLGYPGLAG
jgi:uncharacterized damage-inducible protein DinB